jgi:SAM-dependent methyltransferase
MRVASFGYPDIIASIDPLLKETFAPIEYREDSEAICKRHGLKPRKIPDAHSFFKLMGAELDVYDIIRERGCEIILDLNKPGGEPFKAPQYDIVLDVGTAEHCFQIGQALMNMAEVVKEGGYIIHENPANWGNHGFFNLNPTLFYDFYTDNGFEVQELNLVTRDGRVFKTPPVQRFKFPNEEVNIFCLAKRLRIQPFVLPVQSKYKHLIPAAGAPGERDADARAKGVVNG